MRHKYKKTLKFSTGVQRKDNVIRNLLTSFITHGEMITTPKKAKVLKAKTDSFFARLVKLSIKYDKVVAKREAIRIVKNILYTKEAGKRALDDFLIRYLEEKRTTGFVTDNKLGPRPGDASERILIKLV